MVPYAIVFCQQLHALIVQVADAAATEVERRWAEPFRGYKFWKEVSACAAALHHASTHPVSARSITPSCQLWRWGHAGERAERRRSPISLQEPSCILYALMEFQEAVLRALQGVRKGKADQSRYHSLMRKLLADVKRRAVSGQLLSSSVAGHLLNVRCVTANSVHSGRPALSSRLASACPSPS